MSSGCGDVLSLADLQTAKKHQIFEAEVITGKSGGTATGADIDYATNQVTGQTQKTLPAVLRDVGFSPVSWDFSTGGTLTVDGRDKVVYDPVSKTWYSYAGTLPVTVPAGFNPVGNADWKPQTDPNLRQELESLLGVNLVSDGYFVDFLKKYSFTTGGVVSEFREAVQASDGYWYVWTGNFPKNIDSTPESDVLWRNIGLLNGNDVRSANNFGFENNMADAKPVLDAMASSPFVDLYFPEKSIINISSDWVLSSNTNIDFRGSTLNWMGPVFTLSDVTNGSEMAIINTPNFAGGTAGALVNVHLKNLNIKANDYAIGINYRNITNFSIENIYVEKAQRQGINISNCQNGCINQITLKDCAPLSDKGFTSTQLESWGDGVIIWYGSTNVSVNNIRIESGNNSRGGRCGLCVDGYAPSGKPDPRNISINNAYVYGYDRPMHTELCGVVTVTNSVFEYNSGSNTHNLLQCAVAVWNVLETSTFINCTFRTDKRFMKNSGAKAKFIKCNIYKTSSTDPMFITGVEQTGLVDFDSCVISQAGGTWGAWNSSLYFNNCTISSDSAGAVIDFGSASVAKTLRINTSTLINTSISAVNSPVFTEVHLSSSSIPGDVNCAPYARLFVSNCNITGDVSCSTVMRYSGQKPRNLFSTQNGDQQYNGYWLGTGKPAGARPDGSGEWKRGDMVLNLDAVESAPYLWYCITPGSPGRWSVAGTLGAGF